MNATYFCRCCGKIIPASKALRGHTVSRGAEESLIICEDCKRAMKAQSKAIRENNPAQTRIEKSKSRGVDTPVKYRFTCTEKVENAFLSLCDSRFGLYQVANIAGKATFERFDWCSNSSAFQSSFETFNKWVSVVGNAPITIGIPDEKMESIKAYEKIIFAGLRGSGKEFWGGNGSIVSIAENSLVFGAAAWITPKHYLHTIQMCKDVVACVETWFFGKGADKVAAEKASKQLVKVYTKYSEKRAQCQRPEYNKYGIDY